MIPARKEKETKKGMAILKNLLLFIALLGTSIEPLARIVHPVEGESFVKSGLVKFGLHEGQTAATGSMCSWVSLPLLL
jgi:hypothetical protein